MRIACPYCGFQLDVDPTQGGLETNCPECNGRFQIPVPVAQQAYNPYAHSSIKSGPVQEFAQKKIAAGICGILLGGFGVHKFILGFNGAGITMLLIYVICMMAGCLIFVPVFGCFVIQIIGVIEGVIYLTKTDEEFYQLYAVERKEWF